MIRRLSKKILSFDELDSTNNYCKKLLSNNNIEEGTVVIARNQVSGKGQGTNSWHSEKDKNLTFSLILNPDFIDINDFFKINEFISLGIIDFLKNHGINNAKIKWPNDIYVDDKKICGILIENSIKRSKIDSSIIGIGININQQDFPYKLPNPTSLSLSTNKKYKDLRSELNSLCKYIEKRYNQLETSNNIHKEYLDFVYKLNEETTFKTTDKTFKGLITNITKDGQLEITLKNNTKELYFFKEVEMIIN